MSQETDLKGERELFLFVKIKTKQRRRCYFPLTAGTSCCCAVTYSTRPRAGPVCADVPYVKEEKQAV
jgi:hypothetical protein